MPMKFIPKMQFLQGSDGSILKQLNCPLKKNWTALVVDKTTPLKRFCNSCSRSVIDITEMDEQQIVNLLKIDSDSCFCVRRDSPNIIWDSEEGEWSFSRNRICTVQKGEIVDGCRIVKTARSKEQINTNRDDYIVIIKPVIFNEEIKTKVRLIPDGEKYPRPDDKGYSGFDYRNCFDDKDTNWWHPLKSTHPFAAYLIPKEVEKGEKVYVPDIIEEFIGGRWNQGDVYRLDDGFGIFTGDDIEFDYPTDVDEVEGVMG